MNMVRQFLAKSVVVGLSSRKDWTPTEGGEGEITTVPIASMMEDAMINLGLRRMPNNVKCMKKIASKNQT